MIKSYKYPKVKMSQPLQFSRWDAAVALLTAVGTVPVATATGAPRLATSGPSAGPSGAHGPGNQPLPGRASMRTAQCWDFFSNFVGKYHSQSGNRWQWRILH